MFERLGRQARRDWWPVPSGTLRGKAMGVMGTGSIGRHIALMARPFGLTVRGFSRSGTAVVQFDRVFAAGDRDEFLAGLDYLVCVLHDTPQTRHLLDAGAFDALPDDCYLVNVGRGNLIDEKALSRALLEGKLAGAVLDVFEREPLPPESPLWDAPNPAATIYRSKAVGEPPFMLGISTFLALSDAVAACGPNYPALDAPATPERILRAIARARQ